MYFESHTAFWFFWVLPALFVLYLLFEGRRKRILYSIYPKPVLAKRLGDYNPRSHVWRFLLFFLAVFFLGVALLKPYSDYEVREIKRKGVDLYFLVDLSSSMYAQDVKPRRMDRMRHEIIDFLKMLKGDRVGLIGFAGSAYIFVPLTTDYKAFDLFLGELSPDAIPVPGTDIKGAIEKAVSSFKKLSRTSSKAIILMTDGEDSVGLDPAVIREIKKLGIKVFVVGVGTPDGAPIPLADGGYQKDDAGKVVISRLNEAALQQLALETGGGYVRSVPGDQDLEQIYFQGIKRAFADSEIAARQKKLPVYEFQLPILLAFILVSLEILTTNRRRFWRRAFFGKRSAARSGQKQARMASWVIALAAAFVSVAFEAQAVVNPFAWEKADEHYDKGNYEESLAQYLKILETEPDNPEIHYNLGDTYYRLQKYDEALASFKKALNARDRDMRKKSLYNLGNTLFRKNDLEGALASYEKALQIDENYKKARLNYEYVKKLLEERQQDQQQEQQSQQDQKDKQDQQDQQDKQQEQQGQQDQKDKQDHQDEQDQQQKQQSQQDQKDKQDQQDKQQDQQDQQQDQQQGQQDQQAQQEQDQQPNQPKEQDRQQDDRLDQSDRPERPFKFDQTADQWLESLSDEPGKAIQMLIQKQKEGPRRDIEKKW